MLSHLLDYALQFLSLSLGYILMLLVMTLNLWLVLSVVIGQIAARFLISFTLPKPEKSGLGEPCG